MKVTHNQMIIDALLALADKKGSTREQVWKYVSGKQQYQESIRDKKFFLVQLKRLCQNGEFFHKLEGNHQRYKLEVKFRGRLMKLVKSGKEAKIAIETAMKDHKDEGKKQKDGGGKGGKGDAVSSKKSKSTKTSEGDGSKESKTSHKLKGVLSLKIRPLIGKESKALGSYTSGHLGKKCPKAYLCVNIASKCSKTAINYKQLVQMDKAHGPKGLQILAFPCNQFNNQEPAPAEKIREFADKRDVKFPILEKIEVNGTNTHPIFEYLKNNSNLKNQNIPHNFAKFLVYQNKDGQQIKYYKPTTAPQDILPDISQVLK